MKKIVLITNFEISQYSGSEINAATIAKRLKQLGYTVYIAAMNFDEPLFNDVKENFDECIDLKKDDFDFSNIEFDIVWAHHFFILDWLIFEKNIKAKKIIYSSLSGKEYFEAVPIYFNNLSLILANSEETKEALIREGVKDIYLFENYSFSEYFNKNNKVEKLKNIAVISNHIPEELTLAINLLSKRGYTVDIYGISGKQELITDKILTNYNAIITIGKTVQYAMSLKIPVYIYDRFGGCGYLKMSNMEQNRMHNFSGRSYNKKSPVDLCKDIINDFPNVLFELEKIKEYAYNNFCFENKIDEVLEIIEKKKNVDIEDIRKKYESQTRNLLASKNLMFYFNRRMEKMIEKEKDKVASEYMKVVKEKEEIINDVQESINKLSIKNKIKEIIKKL